MSEPIEVPSAGQPEWRGEITEDKLDDILGGLLIPNQAFAKAMARKLREYMRRVPAADGNRIAVLEGERDYFRNRYRAALVREGQLLDRVLAARKRSKVKAKAKR